MPIVSISDAARLTGKSRRTLHRHIDTGRISKSHTTSDEQGIEISELIRVYGELKTQPVTSGQSKPRLQRDTDDDTEARRIHDLEKEVKSLNRLLSSKQETIDSLKTALKLLEYRQEKKEAIDEQVKENNEPEPKKNGIFVDNNSNTRLLRRLKNIFR